MNSNFDNEIYPQLLLNKGWKPLGQMAYEFGELKVIFDTSSQFQAVRHGRVVSDHYAKNVAEFLAFIDNLTE